jgi:hypothetical protein
MLKDEIRNGDVVRLRNGESITVDSVIESYSDRNGTHPGPFVVTAGRHDYYLVTDVAEIAVRNERTCVFCGNGVTSENPEVGFCRSCFYSGRWAEEERKHLLGKLAALDNVSTASIWHTGGGCFCLAVTLTDGRLVTVTEGEAALPEPGEPWRLAVVSESEEAWGEWDEDRITIFENHEWDDDALVRFVGKL